MTKPAQRIRPGRATAPRPVSLLVSLFGRIGVLFLLIILTAGVATFFTAQRRIDAAYDGQLIISANVLLALMSDELNEAAASTPADSAELQVDDTPLLSAEDRLAFDRYAEWRMFRVWLGPKLVLRSDTGPAEALPPSAEGFSTLMVGKEPWRVFTLRVPSRKVTIEVGERKAIRTALVRGIAIGLVLPLLLLIPTAGFLIWIALQGGLSALRQLLTEIGRRSMRDLSSLPLAPWPRDLHPLIRSFNLLFERIDRSLHQERRFLDDAAHQLRTPLTVVKLQAQLIDLEADPEERRALTALLIASVDRASALTANLLTLARLEARTDAVGNGDLTQETIGAIADLAPLAAKGEVELSYEGELDGPAGGDAVLLRLVATNLIENAIHHAPPASEVMVHLWTSGGVHHLSVTDAGPGILWADRERVLKRFHQGPDGAGSGLGLSIVVEALRLLNGRLRLLDREDGQAGLRACVDLPGAPMNMV